jgi:hypothetical protein
LDGTVTIQYAVTREELKKLFHPLYLPILRVDDTAKMSCETPTNTGEIPCETPINTGVVVAENAVQQPTYAGITPVTYRCSPVDFSNLPEHNLDLQAFRNVNSSRVAKHRAVMKIINAAKEAGTCGQQSLALQVHWYCTATIYRL